MGQCEPFGSGTGGNLPCLAAGRVGGLPGAVGVVGCERRVVDQQVRIRGDLGGGIDRSGIARIDDFPAGTRVADDLVGLDHAAVIEFD